MPRINSAEDIVDVGDRTYSMLDNYDVYGSEEYAELSRRTESAAKQIIEKDREHGRKQFTY